MALKKPQAPPVPANFPKPLHDRLIVTSIPPEGISKGGIIIPESAEEQQNKGWVMAVGNRVGLNTPNKKAIPKVGDMIAYGEYSGMDLEYEGVDYLVMREADILYIL